MTSERSDSVWERARSYTAAQQRTASVALELFADHGVGGTSLQMIADELGVTKAAVYHQFRTKDAIVIAVLEIELARIESALDPASSREQLLVDLLDVVVRNRRAYRTLQHDPVLFRLLAEHAPARTFFTRLFTTLLGEELDARTRVRAAVLSAAIGAVGHPFVDDVDDATLRDVLLDVTRRLVEPD